MDDLTQLRLVRSNLLAQLVEWSNKPPISYTIEGQTVSYAGIFKDLKESLESVNSLILMFDPYEIRTTQDM
jgi:hypothetical protein